MAIDPERFGAAVRNMVDAKLSVLERRITALEAGNKGISTTVTRGLSAYESARAYQAGDTVMTPQDGGIYKARRYTQGLEHPRFSPMSWERLA